MKKGINLIELTIDSSDSYFYIILGGIAILLGYARLYFGVDFLDEGWYVATTAQFSQGAKPFLNEIAPQQVPFILLAPMFRFI